MRKVVFNGKFLAAAPTGVHRVARELIRGVDAELSRAQAGETSWSLYKPRDAQEELPLKVIKTQTVGVTTWQPWEQIDLPLATREALLINLCNLAPLAHPNAITMIHDAQVFSSPGSYRPGFRAWYQFALPKIGRRSRRVLTVSEFSRQQLAEFEVADYGNISVIHNGVDHLNHIAPDPLAVERAGLTNAPYVLALANTQAHKNIALLMRAFSDPLLASFQLVLVGQSTAADFARAGATSPPNAMFVGPVDDASFRGLMERAVCLAFPSSTEGFGLPPLEAMSLGCPTVVAPCGALPEVCGDAALYAPADDAREWVEAVLRLYEDKNLKAQTAALGITQAAKFTWRSAAHHLMSEVRRFAY